MGIVQVDPRTLVIEAKILNGQSLSAALDLNSWKLVAVGMPAAWTAANLTFQAADVLAGTYQDVKDDAGAEKVVTAAAAVWIALRVPLDFTGLRFLKVRSGTSGLPVVQAADRVLKLLVRDLF